MQYNTIQKNLVTQKNLGILLPSRFSQIFLDFHSSDFTSQVNLIWISTINTTIQYAWQCNTIQYKQQQKSGDTEKSCNSPTLQIFSDFSESQIFLDLHSSQLDINNQYNIQYAWQCNTIQYKQKIWCHRKILQFSYPPDFL